MPQGEPGLHGTKGARGETGHKGDRGPLGLPVSTPNAPATVFVHQSVCMCLYYIDGMRVYVLSFICLISLPNPSNPAYNLKVNLASECAVITEFIWY